MPRPKINSAAKNLILKVSRKSSYLGVRGIARILQQKYNLIVSKSSIAAILKKKGLRPPGGAARRGRKPAILEHQERLNRQCGLLLLLCLDSYLGLIDYIAQELKVFIPQLSYEQVKKILIFQSLSAFVSREPLRPELARDFLQLCGMSRLPFGGQAYKDFQRAIEDKKPVISLQTVREKLKYISTIKFYFSNKTAGFTDAQMTTFWDDVCYFERFYFPLQATLMRLEQMLKDRVLIVGYTKSFDYLSRLTFDFIKGVNSGIEKIELLDKEGNVIRRIKLSQQRIVLLFGYCPSIVKKGLVVFPETRRLAKISAERGFEFYGSTSLARFIQPAPQGAAAPRGVAAATEMFLSSTLLKAHFASAFNWGALSTISNKSRQLLPLLKKYLYMWRYVNEDFFQDMEAIQKAVIGHEQKRPLLSNMLPQQLRFDEPADCVRVSQILSVLFKEVVFGWEPKGKPGSFSLGKEAVYIFLKEAPPQLKKHFNRSGFIFSKRQAVLT